MDPRLTAFLAVAREGRLTAAARGLNLSVSSVSQQITSLESEFGVRLFVRSNRGAALTAAGETLRGFAQNIEADWRLALRGVRLAASGGQALHVAASQTVAEIFLPRPLGLYRQLHPEVRLTLSMTNSADVLAQVEAGQVDVGIAEGQHSRTALHVTPLWHDELGLIVSRRHPLATRGAVTLQQMQGVELILRELGSGTRTILESALHSAGQDLEAFRVIMELSSLRAIVSMVRHNVGASVLSRTVISDHGDSDDLSFLPIPQLQLTRQIHLLSRNPDDLRVPAQQLTALLLRESAR